MSRKSRISFGPGAASLILIVVILSMSVLGMLALMNARSDIRFTERSMRVIEAGYALNDRAEKSLAALDAAAAVCAETAEGDEAYLEAWTETDGYRTLDCAVELLPLGETPRLQWNTHRLTAITEETWN